MTERPSTEQVMEAAFDEIHTNGWEGRACDALRSRVQELEQDREKAVNAISEYIAAERQLTAARSVAAAKEADTRLDAAWDALRAIDSARSTEREKE